MAHGRFTTCMLAGLIATTLVATPPAYAGPEWVSFGVLAGAALPDARFADYQWDVSARPAMGAESLAGFGALETGLRLWTAETTQSLGSTGAASPNVRWTSAELLGRARIADVLGARVLGTLSAGRLFLGYSPDRVTFDPGTGSPITVAFEPVHEWIGGAGVAVQRPLAGAYVAGLQLERRFFAMDTAHRNGSTIETRRETFGDWSARVALTWRHGLQ